VVTADRDKEVLCSSTNRDMFSGSKQTVRVQHIGITSLNAMQLDCTRKVINP